MEEAALAVGLGGWLASPGDGAGAMCRGAAGLRTRGCFPVACLPGTRALGVGCCPVGGPRRGAHPTHPRLSDPHK